MKSTARIPDSARRLGPLRAGLVAAALLLPLLLPASAMAESRNEMTWREKLQPYPQPSYPVIRPAGAKYEYLLSTWGKGDRWGVISEAQLQDPSRDRTAIAQARWLVKPEYADVLLPRLTRTQGHLWLKPVGETRWHAFRTDGRKLTALGATPYDKLQLLRGTDQMHLAALSATLSNNPTLRGNYTNVTRADLVLGIHAGSDPASATADLIDAGDNRILLTLSRLDSRELPLLAHDLLLLRHDPASNAGTVIRLPPRPAPEGSYPELQVAAFFRDLRLQGPVASALDDNGNAILLDRELRLFTVPGLALGRPEPPAPHLANVDGIFFKVPVTTADGRRGYQLISRKTDGNPALDPTLWRDIRFMRTYLIAQDMEDRWHLLKWTQQADGHTFPPRQLDGEPVVTTTLAAMEQAITLVNRIDMTQLAAANKAAAEQQAKWRAEAAEIRRQEAAARAAAQAARQAAAQAAQKQQGAIAAARQVIRHLQEGRGESPQGVSAAAETVIGLKGAGFSATDIYSLSAALKRSYGGDRAALAALASALDNLHLAAANGEDFQRRRDSAPRSWGNLAPVELPSLQGAPGLSAAEKDYYDNTGNARNPYVLRERRN